MKWERMDKKYFCIIKKIIDIKSVKQYRLQAFPASTKMQDLMQEQGVWEWDVREHTGASCWAGFTINLTAVVGDGGAVSWICGFSLTGSEAFEDRCILSNAPVHSVRGATTNHVWSVPLYVTCTLCAEGRDVQGQF